jgi:hypothetical protein
MLFQKLVSLSVEARLGLQVRAKFTQWHRHRIFGVVESQQSEILLAGGIVLVVIIERNRPSIPAKSFRSTRPVNQL